MRYERADKLLQLAFEMQAARGGLSLGDIEDRFRVKRRTAMRMRDAVLRSFPQAEEVATRERTKRWRIAPGTLDRIMTFSADELAALDVACRLLAVDNRPDQAAHLAGVSGKLKALMRPEISRKVAPDLDALLEAEGLAMRPGPRPQARAVVVERLREAVKACRKVRIDHRNRRTKVVKERLVHPYGFLHGHRHYLVAWHENPKANAIALFSLPNIENVRITDEPFTRDPDFRLSEFAARAFGVFQNGPALDVVWRFAPEAADDAAEFVFHPSQTMERDENGALIVRFRACGDLEMAWHLYAWGDKVEVLAPASLAALVHPRRVSWPAFP